MNNTENGQLLIYLMTVITTMSTLTPCSHSPVDKRLVRNGRVWFGLVWNARMRGAVWVQEEDQLCRGPDILAG